METNANYEAKGVQFVNHVTKVFFTQSLKFIAFWVAVGGLIFLMGHFIYLFLPFLLAFIMTATIKPLRNLLVCKAPVSYTHLTLPTTPYV